MPSWPATCCAVLCCAVLCCAVLCCAVLCCAVLCCAVQAAWDALQLVLSATPQGFVSFTNPLAQPEEGGPHSSEGVAAHSCLGSTCSSNGGWGSCHVNSSSSLVLTSEGMRRAYSMLTQALSFEDLDKVRGMCLGQQLQLRAGSSCIYVAAALAQPHRAACCAAGNDWHVRGSRGMCCMLCFFGCCLLSWVGGVEMQSASCFTGSTHF
jgi:hypothetical protein